MQPLVIDQHGRHRFKANPIVRYLLDNGSIDLNKIACLEFSDEDQTQLAQLLGYSVSGFSELHYVRDADAEAAFAASDALSGLETMPAEPITAEDIGFAVDEVLAREVVRLNRDSAWNEQRWRDAATRSDSERALRQWYQGELGKLRAWLDEPAVRDEFYSGCPDNEVASRIDAILAGPPKEEGKP